jgi:hypothetical protein
MKAEPDVWFIESWSREAGRGTVRSATGVGLPFDASHATVDRFVLGEEVRVEVADLPSGPRVRCVEPILAPPSFTTTLEAEITVRPTGFLAVRPPEDELWLLEELAFDRLGLASITDGPGASRKYAGHGFLVDGGAVFRALVEAHATSPIDELVEVEAMYPFDWHGLGVLDPLFANIDRQLPGYDPKSPFFFASMVGSSTEWPPPPSLSYSVEPSGVLVFGALARGDWTRWQAAFEHLTSSIPFRRY